MLIRGTRNRPGLHCSQFFIRTSFLTAAYEKALFCLFFIYLSLGNLLRFIQLPMFSDHLLATEVLLYGMSILTLFWLRPPLFSLLLLIFLSMGIFLSFSQGSILLGFDMRACLHALRLVCMIWSAFLLGVLCYKRFQEDAAGFFRFLIRAYLIAAICGLAIYLIFPDSAVFWAFLKQHEVVFHGDPHIGRYISVYLDPNFYGVIAGIPFILSVMMLKCSDLNLPSRLPCSPLELRERNPRSQGKSSILLHLARSKPDRVRNSMEYKYMLYAMGFGLSILMTWSRSGIATFIFILLYFLFCKVKSAKRNFFPKMIMWMPSLIIGIGVLVILRSHHELDFFFNRLVNFIDDSSAYARWKTFQEGLQIVKENPLFGLGYNYPACGYEKLDSSILLLIASFGLFPSFALILFLFFLFLKKHKQIKGGLIQNVFKQADASGCFGKCASELIKQSFGALAFYLCIVVCFSSLFNNVLFYQFWLVPMIAIFTYLGLYTNNMKNRFWAASDSH